MITTVTLNASIDKAYRMGKKIEYGTVMRVAEVRNTAGGKGLNVARVISISGSDVQATGLVGGYNGKYLEFLAEADGIKCVFGHINGETRSCINVLDPVYRSTEFLEPGADVSQLEFERYLKEFPSIIADSDIVTFSGSLPSGISQDAYKRLISIVNKAGKLAILDASGEALRRGIEAFPILVKPNKTEMEDLSKAPIRSFDDVVNCGEKLYKKGIAYVVVSLGNEGALLVCKDGIFQATPPKVNVENTVGCGDSMIAAFAIAFEQKMPSIDALRYAVSVGSAAAVSVNTGEYDLEEQNRIFSQIKIHVIKEGII
ncbi:1-phosphofructokinase [Alkalibaculum bacchi]|uniref:1-phosphofructokinase n=1 Tax=Alkalibaculum bacchi TaxID=645887 RepID=UPI0026F2CC1F|nr:1-phosphofructokinase [Alkalibaculum bacchi]